MKTKFFLVIALFSFIVSCEKDEECKCRGTFVFLNGGGETSAPNVNCDTGEPWLSIQNDGTENPVAFIGCED